MTFDIIKAFRTVTYTKVTVLNGVDHELRLYLPDRVPMENPFGWPPKPTTGLTVRDWTDAAQSLLVAFKITGVTQWERNRAGMCICISCGANERVDIRTAVEQVRKEKGLRV